MNSNNAATDLGLRVGDTDSHGVEVRTIYDRVEGKYIIYEDAAGALRCGDSGIELKNDNKINLLVMKIGDIYATSPKLGRKYNSHRAFAFRYWCRGEIEAAAQALEETYQMMIRAFTRRARLRYISGALLLMMLALILFFTALRFQWMVPRTWLLVSLFGAMGAFVSVSVRGQPPTLDVLEDPKATLLYGLLRAIVAVIFAILVYLLVLGGVLVPEIAKESSARLLVIAFVAGFSEKLVPEAVIHHAIAGGAR